MAMGSLFRINQGHSTRDRESKVSSRGMAAWFKIMGSFMKVSGAITGLMALGMSRTLSCQDRLMAICSLALSKCPRGVTGVRFSNNRNKNYTMGNGKLTTCMGGFSWNTLMARWNWSILWMGNVTLPGKKLSPSICCQDFPKRLPFPWLRRVVSEKNWVLSWCLAQDHGRP